MTAVHDSPGSLDQDAEPTAVVTVSVNGAEVTGRVPVRMHAADFLRQRLGLTGTHVGCEQGVCGMCTVIVDGEAVKSCLMLACQLDGRAVRTVESLAEGDRLGPLQEAFAARGALQCGFCTPGLLMTATALAYQGGRPDREAVREEIAGVLCRCTGYEPIVTAIEEYFAGLPETGEEEENART
ncbi:carbon-monoxide dehydrogenase small subunit [Thermocatellispora tengchongensis]|uniref:Carbon-monoxide dehydrogenase small subunit n=1 Tax=Thermocatellispora tengchongensis TaxID=1073253 RepID=A0A840PJY5_9ACTN|nr:2Fe-2S iron-sulfur cluster-binding protein [Thermocatellispora tengchongensis]MBB5137900.1 carbon-monoxide dehydrogenase small subunit [Thermocatellispora tengchongensis]